MDLEIWYDLDILQSVLQKVLPKNTDVYCQSKHPRL